MKRLHPSLGAALAAAAFSTPGFAATVFNNASPTDNLITNAGNWDNGLPVGQQGTITVDAGFNDDVDGPLVGYDILHTDGTLGRTAGNSGLEMSGSSWVMNGAGAAFNGNHRGMLLKDSSTFTLNNGTYTITETNRDVAVDNSSLTINGGAFNATRSMKVTNGGVFTMTGGTATWLASGSTFGEGGFVVGINTMNLNGGTITADRFVFQRDGTVANFGGTTAGSATFNDWGTGNGLGNNGDRADDRNIALDFKAGSLMELSMLATTRELDFDDDTVGDAGAAWAEALWETGRLTYTDGATTVSGFDPDSETNGWTIVSWADATNSAVGFGTASSEYFDWTAAGSFGGSLALGDTGGGGPDITPPNWEATYPQVTDATDTGATARASINENGTAYFVVLADGATAPSSAQVKAGNDASDSPAIDSGSMALTANTENTEAITGLSASTAYDVYFVAEDDEGTPNLQAAPVLVEFSTSSSSNPYETWATGGDLFGDDENEDGVPNGLAFLLGAADPDADATGLLPAVTVDGSGNLILTFSMRNAANRGSASLSTQHSSDLGVADLWDATNNESLVPEGPGTGIVVGVVSFDVMANGNFNDVQATIPAGEGNGSGKLFGRLIASE